MGEGHTTALFWEYDARLGRRWNVDPITKVGQSPYSVLSNNPIIKYDEYGDCDDCPKPEKEGKGESDKSVTTHTNYMSKNPYEESKSWYWHSGSTQGEQKFEKGWYSESDYKNILTGSSGSGGTGINIKALLKDLVGSKETITEKDLSVDEIVALRKMVLNNVSKGKSVIEYKDYQTTKSGDPYSDVAGNSAKDGYGNNSGEAWNVQSNPYYNLSSINNL